VQEARQQIQALTLVGMAQVLQSRVFQPLWVVAAVRHSTIQDWARRQIEASLVEAAVPGLLVFQMVQPAVAALR
jgi:hypothetical protein